jgi:hypothetical protein
MSLPSSAALHNSRHCVGRRRNVGVQTCAPSPAAATLRISLGRARSPGVSPVSPGADVGRGEPNQSRRRCGPGGAQSVPAHMRADVEESSPWRACGTGGDAAEGTYMESPPRRRAMRTSVAKAFLRLRARVRVRACARVCVRACACVPVCLRRRADGVPAAEKGPGGCERSPLCGR